MARAKQPVSTCTLHGKPVKLEILKDSLTGPTHVDGPLVVGSLEPGTPFKGRLDDLRVYRRPLTATEISHLQNQEPLRAILAIQPDKRPKDQKEWIRNYYLTNAAPAENRTTWAELKTLRETAKKLEAVIPTSMVMSELEKPRDTFILARGDYRNHGDKVVPGVPAVLAASSERCAAHPPRRWRNGWWTPRIPSPPE